MPSTGWSLGIVVADSEISGDVVALNSTQWTVALAGIAALLVITLLIAGSITRPIRGLDAATGRWRTATSTRPCRRPRGATRSPA